LKSLITWQEENRDASAHQSIKDNIDKDIVDATASEGNGQANNEACLKKFGFYVK
jgi:hypothetical protein